MLGAVAHPDERVAFIAACRAVRRRTHERAAAFAMGRLPGPGDCREGFRAENLEIRGAVGRDLPDMYAVRVF